ncbi:C40 family peptidase [Streptomyces sp. NBC_01262]|jgi:cell wall-associated NlpC family hydrolase|uniref:C40 family peptidase n=1 Tax=Streptomyces sp. NBC_01262 TaxID=2903803 RepID=UPI002E338B9A|nr:NlpC/P60 family protein [Streptomyces sp. NBC_01262]
MSLTTSPADPTDSHIRRRRHATQSNPNWARRAGIAGGVIGTIALTGMSAPANADTVSADPTATGSIPVVPLSTATTAAQAVDALDQTALDFQVDAEKDAAYDAAIKQAEKARLQADRRAAAQKAADKARETAAAASRSSERTSLSTSTSSGSIATVISFLKSQVGKPYVYGANGPYAYDCSSLTKAAFATIGVELPRTAAQQSTVGTAVSVSDVQVGDLLFWGGRGSAYHVAVYVGNGEYLDAANPSKGVVIQKMAYYMPTSAVRVA